MLNGLFSKSFSFFYHVAGKKEWLILIAVKFSHVKYLISKNIFSGAFMIFQELNNSILVAL